MAGLLFTDRGLRFEQLRLLEAPSVAARVHGGIVDVSASTLAWLEDGARSLAKVTGDVRVDEVEPQQIYDWHLSLLRRMRPVTANSYLRAVKTLFGRLLGAGVVAVNPARPVPFAAEPRPSPKAIRESDYLALRSAATDARDRALVDVLWASGCRLGGLLSMRLDRMERWEDAGRQCFALYVVEKGEKPRYVYVGQEREQGDALVAWLDVRPVCDVLDVWLTRREPFRRLSAVGVQHVLRRLKVKADVPRSRPCNPHAFRHAFALRMLDAGHDLAAVSAWLGHYSPQFTASVYAIRPEQALRAKYFSG